jgi:hypothetical protein
VARAQTWGEVVTKIGRQDNAKARRVVQGHAVRLGLDSGHLPAFKPLEPIYPHDATAASVDLAAIIPDASTWAEVLRRAGLSVSGSTQAALRRRAEQLGLDTSHFRGQAWNSAPVPGTETPFERPPNENYLHRAATALATAWFLGRGYMVSLPVEPALYDLITESDDGLIRVQVKSTRTQDTRSHWYVHINRRAYDSSAKQTTVGARSQRTYGADEIDYFFIVTAGGDKYLIPLPVTRNLASLTLDSKYAAFKVS